MQGKPSFLPWVPSIERDGFSKRSASMSAVSTATSEYLKRIDAMVNSDGAERMSAERGLYTRQTLIYERKWIAKGRPYLKVFPGVADSLANTTYDFCGSHIDLPFSEFVVMVPRGLAGVPMAIFVTSPSMRELSENGVLGELGRAYGDEFLPIRLVWFAFIVGTERYQTMAPCYKDRTIEQSIKAMAGLDVGDIVSQAMQAGVRVAIGASSLAVNSHPLVTPEIDVNALRKANRAGRSKAAKAISESRIQKKIANCKRFRVGGEIDLPRLHSQGGISKGAGSRLTQGHIRSGHMRMQPCGKKNKERKLIFIAPMIIRPDLEMRESRGYKITDSVAT